MDIERELRGLIVEQLGVTAEEVRAEASFLGDLGEDSLDLVEFVMAVEEHFAIKIPNEEAKQIELVSDVIECVRKRTRKHFS